jgi:maleate isomerase
MLGGCQIKIQASRRSGMAGWRGTIGVVKPGMGTGSTEEFIRLMPEGVRVIPTVAGIREYNAEGFRDALDSYKERVAELAGLGICDLIHPEGAPPFMVRGLAAERELVAEWESRYEVPVFTSGMTQAAALRALGVQRLLGYSFFGGTLSDMFTRYFVDAGFDVAGMETMPTRSPDWPTPSAEDLYMHIKRAFVRHSGVQGIYLLGSASWRLADIHILEDDLRIPVVHPVAARVWYVQKRLQLHQPVPGYSRLLEEMP